MYRSAKRRCVQTPTRRRDRSIDFRTRLIAYILVNSDTVIKAKIQSIYVSVRPTEFGCMFPTYTTIDSVYKSRQGRHLIELIKMRIIRCQKGDSNGGPRTLVGRKWLVQILNYLDIDVLQHFVDRHCWQFFAEVTIEKLNAISKRYLVENLADMYKLGALTIKRNDEEERCLSTFNAYDIDITLNGLRVTPDVVYAILDYLEYDYDLITSVGLASFNFYALVITNWQGVLAVDSTNCYSIPRSVWLSCREIVIERKLFPPSNLTDEDLDRIVKNMSGGKFTRLFLNQPQLFIQKLQTQPPATVRYPHLQVLAIKNTLLVKYDFVEIAPNLVTFINPTCLSNINGLHRLRTVVFVIRRQLTDTVLNYTVKDKDALFKLQKVNLRACRNDFLSAVIAIITPETVRVLRRLESLTIKFIGLATITEFAIGNALLEICLSPGTNMKSLRIMNSPTCPWLIMDLRHLQCSQLQQLMFFDTNSESYSPRIRVYLPDNITNLSVMKYSIKCGGVVSFNRILAQNLPHLTVLELSCMYFGGASLTDAERTDVMKQIPRLKQLKFILEISYFEILNYGRCFNIFDLGMQSQAHKLPEFITRLVKEIKQNSDIVLYIVQMYRSSLSLCTYPSYLNIAQCVFDISLKLDCKTHNFITYKGTRQDLL